MDGNDKLFSGKSEIYSKFRPVYPKEIIQTLTNKYGLTGSMTVADIGCGTGILSRMFLENGNKVLCIDPNEEMLEICRKGLSGYEKATIMKGYAEKTGLEDHSVNVITAGQSFHWFNVDKTTREFRRILRAPNMVALIWNDRDNKDNFTSEFENVVSKYSKGYHGTGSSAISDDLISQFFNWSYGYYQYPNFQELDFDGLVGRYSSASYSLSAEDEKYSKTISSLKEAFNTYEKNGKVVIKYTTKLYVGKII